MEGKSIGLKVMILKKMMNTEYHEIVWKHRKIDSFVIQQELRQKLFWTKNIFLLIFLPFISDHDECEQLGDSQSMNTGKGGHFCTQPHSICVNTFGSYKCKFDDRYQCYSPLRHFKILPQFFPFSF